MDALKYRPCSAEVISDSVEGVVVVINLLSGRYYSLNPAASELWSQVQASGGVIVSDESDVGVARLLSDLADEGLLLRSEAPEGDVALRLDAPAVMVGDLSFAAHSDLQELLALDPIHEVDPSAGWPHQ